MHNLVFAVLTVILVGIVAAVAAGVLRGTLDEPTSSIPPVELPEGPITARDVAALQLSPALRGYRMDQVDEVLDRLAHELQQRDTRIAQLTGHHPQPTDVP